MEVFVVIIEDRHCDVQCEVFSTRDLAVDYARGISERHASSIDDIDERLTPEMKDSGWVYFAIY